VPQTLGISEPAAFGISAKMAKALTDEWRFRILTELSVRTLSPSQFVEEVGGELTHISRCFRQLANWGYVEVIEERPGRRRGAAVEHVYRGIQRAHFNTSAWKGVPRTRRDALSISVLESYFDRVTEAIETGTFDDEIDRHLSWDGIVLDRVAWTQLVTRLDQVLDWLSALKVQAAERIAKTEEEAIPTTVGLAAFRSPRHPEVVISSPRRYPTTAGLSSARPPVTISPKMARALSNRWRSRILMELNARPLSPSQFVEEIGGSMTHVSRCFRQLAEWGYAEVIEERKGGRHGGGVERVYRNTQRAYFDTATWETLPRFLRNEVSNSFLASYLARITEALEADTFDAENDRHLSWTPAVLDRTAWSELVSRLDEILDWLPKLEAEATERMKVTAEEPISTTIGLAAFRSPNASRGRTKPLQKPS
jgi:DNA-binding transcriptional regulator GbsR (MarR family)